MFMVDISGTIKKINNGMTTEMLSVDDHKGFTDRLSQMGFEHR